MNTAAKVPRRLWAVADLHAAIKPNRERLAELRPPNPRDWLIVAGDVAERTERVIDVLERLARRYEQVIWVPGNHELFSRSTDTCQGRDKYQELVDACRRIGVLSPEDSYAVFGGVTIVPLFTLYDYSFRIAGLSVEDALEQARNKGVVMTDEVAIAPFVDIRAWCWDRLTYSIRRLSKISGPTILINHWPLVQEPTMSLRYSELALWCGTRHTRSWPVRYEALKVIYGHLHMPRRLVIDGIEHIDTSLGYPREWRNRSNHQPWPYPVLEIGADGHAR
ncbi:metallophosphoesterase family protein [Corynebacterium caspium]|uniref:metallophosphoesterase family protein n=1 Tax=Corynebacterium caspium TaxID=234828 RepID=UPI000366A591|nr:metallophosphoesterase [Corynebacterium caspium]WKD59093.1 serine/threonine protein phosphatase 1 [Corynebacterium caspium DSM 44850]